MVACRVTGVLMGLTEVRWSGRRRVGYELDEGGELFFHLFKPELEVTDPLPKLENQVLYNG